MQFAYQVQMEEPSPRSSRLALAGAVAAIIVLGGGGFLLGRSTVEPPPAQIAPLAAAPAPEPSPQPLSDSVLGRADLIDLAAMAADAAAAGRLPDPELAQVDGRRFELRLPFGCGGPMGEDSSAAMGWRYDAQDEVLRLRVAPITWAPQQWWPEDAASDAETVEGFWIRRPWITSEACPAGGRATAPGAEPVTLPGQTLAVGQIFFAEGARRARRNGEPYEAAIRVPEGELDTSQGFRLRISGRVVRTHGLGPVRCQQPTSTEQRPVCLISVVMDEVAIENPAIDEILATWSLGGRSAPGS